MTNSFTLETYHEILKKGLESGYEFLTFDQIDKESGNYSCILRHDIDSELWSCNAFSTLEKSLGIRSTYFLMTRSTAYNLFCIESLRIVEQLLKDGHSLGLHFMGELTEGDDEKVLINKIEKETKWIENEFGVKIASVSFHQPSRVILDNPVFVNDLINTYNKIQMRDYFYISDTNMIWKHEHPKEVFQYRIYPRLQLLTHPIWWTEKPQSLKEKWLNVLNYNNQQLVGHWKQRERSLQEIDFEELHHVYKS